MESVPKHINARFELLQFVFFMAYCSVIAFVATYLERFGLSSQEIGTTMAVGSIEMGYATAITAAVEIPAIVLYKPLRKKFSCSIILLFATVCFLLKSLVTTATTFSVAVAGIAGGLLIEGFDVQFAFDVFAACAGIALIIQIPLTLAAHRKQENA